MKYLIILLLIPLGVCSQDKFVPINKLAWQKNIAITGYSGNVFVHTQSVKSVEGAMPTGFSIDFAKQMNDEGSYQLSSAYPQKGISFSYFNFGTPILDKGYLLSYFIQPVYRLSNRFQIQLRAEMGLGYLTNPFDSVTNATNKNYSLYVNPYMRVGIGIGYRITNHITASLNTNFHHISNGSYHQPNSGLNFTSTSFSINYFSGNNVMKKYGSIPKGYSKGMKPTLDVGLLYVPQQGYNNKLGAQRKYTLGFFTQLTKQVGRTSALNIGAEVYHNEFINITDVNIKTNPYLFAGIYGGHEFVLGRIIFSQQIGIYITNHSSYFSNTFKRFGLQYKISPHWLAGFNLKIHSDEADFTDLRLIYRL